MPNQSNQDKPALTVDEARSAILNLIEPTTNTETVSLCDAPGRIAAEDIHAQHNIPMFRNSAMDGYAIRHKDAIAGAKFRIIGSSLAGHPYTDPLAEGEAVKITTGAQTPVNADAIVIQELAELNGDFFATSATIKHNRYIRNPGDDISKGQPLLTANSRINAADTGLLAAQGIDRVTVFSKPVVGVFSTGDELCRSSESIQDGQIFESNCTTIRSLLKLAGIESVDLGICKDDPDDIEKLMQSATGYDFILSSGGVSVGVADFVKETLERNGELLFWKVAMKPGKPMVTGKLSSGAFYFGLPGNPVSSMVTCVQFVIPALQSFSGSEYQPPPTLQAKCLVELKKEVGRFEFQRGRAALSENGEMQVSTTGLQDSHVLSSMSQANCFICLDQFADGAAKGDKVSIVLFDSYYGLR